MSRPYLATRWPIFGHTLATHRGRVDSAIGRTTDSPRYGEETETAPGDYRVGEKDRREGWTRDGALVARGRTQSHLDSRRPQQVGWHDGRRAGARDGAGPRDQVVEEGNSSQEEAREEEVTSGRRALHQRRWG